MTWLFSGWKFQLKPLKACLTSSQPNSSSPKNTFFFYLWNAVKLQFHTHFWKRAVYRGLSVELCQSITEGISIYFSPCLSLSSSFFTAECRRNVDLTKSWKSKVNSAAACWFGMNTLTQGCYCTHWSWYFTLTMASLICTEWLKWKCSEACTGNGNSARVLKPHDSNKV